MDNQKDIETQLQSLTEVKLSSAEKVHGRNLLEAHMQKDAAPTPAPTGSQFTAFRLQHFSALMVASLVLVVGVGTSAASERALPGDILYPVKVTFNEEIRSLLADSGESKAAWELARTERRIDEGSELALANALTDENRLILGNLTERHLSNARNATPDSIAMQTNISATQDAYEAIVGAIPADDAMVLSATSIAMESAPARGEANTDTATEEQPRLEFAADVRAEHMEVRILPNRRRDEDDAQKAIGGAPALPQAAVAEQQVSAASEETVRGKRMAARTRLQAVARLVARSSDARLQQALQDAQVAYTQGEAAFNIKKWADASAHFTMAFDRALLLHKQIVQQ